MLITAIELLILLLPFALLLLATKQKISFFVVRRALITCATILGGVSILNCIEVLFDVNILLAESTILTGDRWWNTIVAPISLIVMLMVYIETPPAEED